MKRASVILTVLTVAGISATVPGGPVAHAAPDAEPIYARARKVTTAAKSLKATLRLTINEGKQSGTMSGSVELLKPNYGRISVRGAGAMEKGGTQQLISTGKKRYVVSTKDKSFMVAPAEPKAENLFQMLGAILTPIGGFTSPGIIRREGTVRSVNSVSVNGKPYQKVVVSAKEAPEERVLFFGKSGLLEGIEYTTRQQGNVVVFKMWLGNVTLNAPLSARQFAYSPPAGYTARDTSSEGSLLALGSKAPDFSLPGAFGGKYSLKELVRGKKATLVSFWFLNCGPCRMELPHLAKQYPRWKKRGLGIVAVNSDDAVKDIQQYIFEEKLNYPVAMAVGSRDKILNSFKVEAFPTVYLLDQNGKIVWRKVGFDPDGLDVALEKALGK